MSPATLANLAAWCVQTALIVGAGLATLWLVRLEAPAVRYLFLRVLLAFCLTLPLAQPRLRVQSAVQKSTSAGIACAVMAGASYEEAAAFGNLAASITVQQIGVTGTATPQQVRDRWIEV